LLFLFWKELFIEKQSVQEPINLLKRSGEGFLLEGHGGSGFVFHTFIMARIGPKVKGSGPFRNEP
jgi:hypothetical protein